MEKEHRHGRKTFQGVVVSDKMNKTRVVSVERTVKHPRYEKVIRKTSKFYVHDEDNESHIGDIVGIVSARPLSKLKRWRVAQIIAKSKI